MSRDREKSLRVAEDGKAGGANTLVAEQLRNWGKGRFGKLGVWGDWEVQEFRKTGRLEEIR